MIDDLTEILAQGQRRVSWAEFEALRSRVETLERRLNTPVRAEPKQVQSTAQAPLELGDR